MKTEIKNPTRFKTSFGNLGFGELFALDKDRSARSDDDDVYIKTTGGYALRLGNGHRIHVHEHIEVRRVNKITVELAP